MILTNSNVTQLMNQNCQAIFYNKTCNVWTLDMTTVAMMQPTIASKCIYSGITAPSSRS